jgi:hypothetical protein
LKYQEIPVNLRKYWEISGNNTFLEIFTIFFLMPSPGKTPGNSYIFIRKYQEISGNTTKYQEIQDQIHEKLGNTLVFLRDSCSTWVFLLSGS